MIFMFSTHNQLPNSHPKQNANGRANLSRNRTPSHPNLLLNENNTSSQILLFASCKINQISPKSKTAPYEPKNHMFSRQSATNPLASLVENQQPKPCSRQAKARNS